MRIAARQGAFARSGIFCLILFNAASVPLRADLLSGNLTGPCCGGDSVTGARFNTESLAVEFIPPITEPLADAEVVVFRVAGGAGDSNFNLSVYADGGGAPGAFIEELVANLMAAGAPGGIVMAKSRLNPLLAANTAYWLVLTPGGASTAIGWEQGGSFAVPADFTRSATGAGGWAPIGGPNPNLQFEIDGAAVSAVPESGSLLLLATVLGAILAARRAAASFGYVPAVRRQAVAVRRDRA